METKIFLGSVNRIQRYHRKMNTEFTRDSKKKVPCKRLGGYLKEQKGRLYIIRRCVVMLLCWHD
ncbi:hypothetical protein Lalb_Chr17g0336511 [Lupinus albus]|uniref:Uncharacterized protein n=1 Tax=Lupinus albus TaxID=3870 RepID=A0A6A4P1D9_LUPAL|nr:hypothetical protein Lalb_Chr17g0336511 [Lupinus albus]